MRTLVFGILVGTTCLLVAGLSGCGDETCIQEMAAASIEREANLARTDTGKTGAVSAQSAEGSAGTAAQELAGLPEAVVPVVPVVPVAPVAPAGTVRTEETGITGKNGEADVPQPSSFATGLQIPAADELLAEAPTAQKRTVKSETQKEVLPEMEENRLPLMPEKKPVETLADAQKASAELVSAARAARLPVAKSAAAQEEKKAETARNEENVPGLENFAIGMDIQLPDMPAKSAPAAVESKADVVVGTGGAESESHRKLNEQLELTRIADQLKETVNLPAKEEKEEIKTAAAGIAGNGHNAVEGVAKAVPAKSEEVIEDSWQSDMLASLNTETGETAKKDAPAAGEKPAAGKVTIAEEVGGSAEAAPVAAAAEELPEMLAEPKKSAVIADEQPAAQVAPAAEEKAKTEEAPAAAQAPAAEEKAKTEEAPVAAKNPVVEKVEEKKDESAAKPAEAANAKPAEAPVAAEKPVDDAAAKTAAPTADPKEELIRLEKIRREARLAEGRNNYETGVKYFNAGQYQEALNFFDKALQADPGLQDAVAMRTRARQLVGRTDNVEDDSQLMNEISRNQNARLRERELSINNSLEKADNYYVNAVNPDALRKTLPRGEQIKAGLDDLEQSLKEAQAAELLLQGAGLPKSVENTLDRRIKALKAQVSEARRSLAEERGMIDRREAQEKAAAQKQSLAEQHVKEMDQLFAGVDTFFRRMEYEKALEAVNKIIQLDPTNLKAQELKKKIETANHQQTQIESGKELASAEDNWAVDVKEATIMPRKMLIYPLDWDRIKQRAIQQSHAGTVDFERQRIINALSAVTGTVEYAELPLNLVMEDFRRRAKVNIMLNPEVDAEMPITITLREVSLWVAFETILKANKLEFTVKDQAIEVFKKGSGGSADVILKIFQVADLTTPKVNYYAPRINEGDEGTSWGDDDDDDDDDDDWEVPQTPLKDQIKKYVCPDKWESNPLYSLEIWNDNLLVKATPEMIAQVSKFLDKLRESAKLQVFVEGRFMDISDTFSEMIGFDWSGTFSDSKTDQSKMLQGAMSITPLATNSPSSYSSSHNNNSGMHTSYESAWSNNPVNYLLSSLGLKLVVDAAQNTQKGSVLHNPKVLVANGHNAYARVIVLTPYITNYSIVGTSAMPTVTQIPQGVTWDVRPIVSFDRKYITIRVRPRIEEIDTENALVVNGDTDRNHDGIPDNIVGVTDGDVTYNWEIDITNPVLKQTLFETNATVPDGGTLLIGGQLKENSAESITGIPILTSIPKLGRFFRTNMTSRSGQNRVIMVSAKIVDLED